MKFETNHLGQMFCIYKMHTSRTYNLHDNPFIGNNLPDLLYQISLSNKNLIEEAHVDHGMVVENLWWARIEYRGLGKQTVLL